MISVGNDIVGLNHIDIHRTRQPRFYSKILSATEQQLYSQQLNIPFEYFVWLLWSIKESAYKYLQRQQPELVFSPVKIEVSCIIPPAPPLPFPVPAVIEKTGFQLPDYFEARVSFNSQTLHARSVIYGDDLIHTVVCSENNFEQISWGVKHTLETDHSAAVRLFLLAKLNTLFPGKALSIDKSKDGVPYIKIGDDGVIIPVSLSHHGKYVGYATPLLFKTIKNCKPCFLLK